MPVLMERTECTTHHQEVISAGIGKALSASTLALRAAAHRPSAQITRRQDCLTIHLVSLSTMSGAIRTTKGQT